MSFLVVTSHAYLKCNIILCHYAIKHFLLFVLKQRTDLLQILYGFSLDGLLPSLLIPICNGIMGILCNFWPINKSSSIKPLTRYHSYLGWRVHREPSL